MHNKKSEGISLLVINDLIEGSGGAEVRVRSLLTQLHSYGQIKEIAVLSKDIPSGDSNIKKYFSHYQIKSSEDYAGLYNLMRCIVQKHRCDIIQIHNLSDYALVNVLLRIKEEFKLKIIFFAHDFYPICGKRSFIDPFNACVGYCRKTGPIKCMSCIGPRTYIRFSMRKKLLNKIDLGIAPSKEFINISETNNFLKGKWSLIRPWVDPLIFNYKVKARMPQKRKEIIFVGSLAPYKGAFVLAKSIKHLKGKLDNFCVSFIGSEGRDDAYRKGIEDILTRDGALSHAKFIERVPKHRLYGIMSSSSALVFPSVCLESFGQVWAEAAFFGLQVIASDIPTLKGYYPYFNFFKTGNEIDLANKLIKVLKNSAAGHGNVFSPKKASDFVRDNFNINSSSNNIVELYCSLAARS